MMTDDDQTRPDPAVARRQLLRGGAVLAGAAGITAVGAVVAAPAAQAADGDQLVLGEANEAESSTSITIGGADGDPEVALSLTNADGPSLYLSPLPDDWGGDLSPGQIANTTAGPLIGVVQGGNTITTQLLTEQDVWLPFILPTPMRLVDTRTVSGRQRVLPGTTLAADGRLPAGRSLTFWIAPVSPEFGIPAVHLNLTVVGPTANGYAVAYPGPDRPPTSTINFMKGQTVANGAFIGTSIQTVVIPDLGSDPIPVQVMSVFTTAAAWIVVDGTGAFATGSVPPLDEDQAQRRARSRRDSPATRAQRAFGKL